MKEQPTRPDSNDQLAARTGSVPKTMTGIPGLDGVTMGGLPQGRVTLVVGSTGSAKTILGTHFLAAGVADFNEGAVFVTFEESPASIRQNMAGFGWNIPEWEAAGKWAFVDAAPKSSAEVLTEGNYDLGALIARIEHAVRKTNAKRVTIDSLGAIFFQLTDTRGLRRELQRLAVALNQMNVTAIITAERLEEYGAITRDGIEEFVADNVMVLRNVLTQGRRRRTLEVLKFRGTVHQKGEYPFSVTTEGFILVPLTALGLEQRSSNERTLTGIDALDEMCGGGFFRDSVVLISGATGTGKTLSCTQFIASGAERGERSFIYGLEESRDQLFRNAASWGRPFNELEEAGMLRAECVYPEYRTLEEHFVAIKDTVEEFHPKRVGVDSLTALERISNRKDFREFVIGLTSYLKHKEITGMLTASTSNLMGGPSVTEEHISTITDTIILLRYVEVMGEMRRGIAVLKMRGSQHAKHIREYTIDGQGMHIGKPFRNITGVILGMQSQAFVDEERSRLEDLFPQGGA